MSAGPDLGSRVVLVVCDGVSTSRDGDLASRAAARAACDALAGAAPPVDPLTWESLLGEACEAASVAVVDVTRGDRANDAPSTTLVAGVVVDGVFVAGSVGDSRAYWVPDHGPARVLTADDSWATERIEAGLAPAQAERLPGAHVITRWIGVDSPGDAPRTGSIGVSTAGWAVLCSDGLWNYCSPADDLARLVRTASDEHDQQALAVASGLVSWANERGGHDNISVALARVVPPGPREAAGTPAA